MTLNYSENLAEEMLTKAFKNTFSDVRVLTGLIINLPPPSRITTGEFDCMVVCNAGLFIFEIKGWQNCKVSRKLVGSKKQWFLENSHGFDIEVADPIAQGVEKLTALKTYIDKRVSFRCYVLVPCKGVVLDGELPAGIVTAQELSYLPRLVRSLTKISSTNVELDSAMVNALADGLLELAAGNTMSSHISELQSFHSKKRAGTALNP